MSRTSPSGAPAGIRLLTLAAAALASAPALLAQPRTHGPERQVNSYTTSDQFSPQVAMDGQGDFVVVWWSRNSDGEDQDGSVQGQRFTKEGAFAGSQFQVNSYTTAYQIQPSIAMDGQGDFVVTWISYGVSHLDPDGVRGQLYAAGGNPIGSELQVDTYPLNAFGPEVARNGDGSFVVVWSSYGSEGDDQDSYSVQGRRYDSNGDAVGSQFQVNTYTTNWQQYPAVAIDSTGAFVVAWESQGSAETDTDVLSIQAQRFDSAGVKVGSQFQVNSTTTSYQWKPAIAMDSAGNFTVLWASPPDVLGQRYASGGNAIGSEFHVNEVPGLSGAFRSVEAASDDSGGFAVVWDDTASAGDDIDANSVHARRFTAAGAPFGAEFQVNTYTTGAQRFPDIAMNGPGDFVVVWHGAGSSGDDDSGYSIQAQPYDALFRDSFEIDELSRWSSHVP